MASSPPEPKSWPALDSGKPETATAAPAPARATPEARHFVAGKQYTRASVAQSIGRDDLKGGSWATGYSRVDGEFYLFTTIGAAGRTGHDYPNRWDGDRLIWSAKTGTKLDQPEIKKLLSGDYPVHLFHRSGDRSPFTYGGLVAPVDVQDASPVVVRWELNSLDANWPQILPPAHQRPGPPPAYGGWTSLREDGPISVYLLELQGPVSALFPNIPAGYHIIKIGMSNDPLRRLGDLSCGLPRSCAVRWRLLTERKFSNGREAYEAEQAVLARLRRESWSIGGEFGAVPPTEMDALRDLETAIASCMKA